MNTDRLLFGAAYYEEYMPYYRTPQDMELLKKAGMNTIRIGESTWSTWEKADGVFDFSHLHSMLKNAEEHGISVIIGTPTYAVPAWLVKKYPEILPVTHGGQNLYGHRQNMDITNPDYLFHAERIIRKMLEEIKDYPNIIGFQLDNETKAYDTCSPYAQKKFVEYLKEKFGTTEAMNQAFGLDYWSNRIDSWEDFPDVRGTINGSLGAEYERFSRKLVTDFLAWQAAIVREYKRADQFITQNFDYSWTGHSFGLQSEVNQWEAAEALTVAGVDIYHPSADSLTGKEIAMGGAIAYGIKKTNYLLLETQAQGNPGWLPFKGQLRLQAYSHLACGANSVMYWHFHSIHNSLETYWKGVLSHNLAENETYREAMRIGAEFRNYSSVLKNLKKKSRAAFLLSNDALTGLKWFPIANGKLSYNHIFRWLFDACYELNLECDILSPADTNLSDYEVLFVPALYSASEELLSRLNTYVKNGGHLVTTFKTGFCNENLKVYADNQPHLLTECAGMTYDRFTIPAPLFLKPEPETDCGSAGNMSGSVGNASCPAGSSAFPSEKAAVSDWIELLEPASASVWCRYDHPHYKEYAAVTHNLYGKGSCTYLGCYFDAAALKPLLLRLFKEIGLTLPEFGFPLILKQGTNENGEHIRYYLNYSDNPETASYDGADGTLLFSGSAVHRGDKLTVDGWDLQIVVSRE